MNENKDVSRRNSASRPSAERQNDSAMPVLFQAPDLQPARKAAATVAPQSSQIGMTQPGPEVSANHGTPDHGTDAKVIDNNATDGIDAAGTRSTATIDAEIHQFVGPVQPADTSTVGTSTAATGKSDAAAQAEFEQSESGESKSTVTPGQTIATTDATPHGEQPMPAMVARGHDDSVDSMVSRWLAQLPDWWEAVTSPIGRTASVIAIVAILIFSISAMQWTPPEQQDGEGQTVQQSEPPVPEQMAKVQTPEVAAPAVAQQKSPGTIGQPLTAQEVLQHMPPRLGGRVAPSGEANLTADGTPVPTFVIPSQRNSVPHLAGRPTVDNNRLAKRPGGTQAGNSQPIGPATSGANANGGPVMPASYPASSQYPPASSPGSNPGGNFTVPQSGSYPVQPTGNSSVRPYTPPISTGTPSAPTQDNYQLR